jgi:hypothetical protein
MRTENALADQKASRPKGQRGLAIALALHVGMRRIWFILSLRSQPK